MAITSLILGIIGTVTGIGALAWQVITWTQNGPVVTLTTGPGYHSAGMTITTVNSGRGPVSVMHLDFCNASGFGIGLDSGLDSELPFRLEPGASESWHVDISAIADLLRKSLGNQTWVKELDALTDPKHGRDYESNLRVHAVLGNGKTISAPITRGRP